MFNQNIKKLARDGSNFRRVIYTGKNIQLVLMSIPPNGDIGNEAHETIDQILFFVEGVGEAVLNNTEKQRVKKDSVVFVPAGTWHNFINTGDKDLKLYTVYSPPAHKDGTVHKTKIDADKEEKY